MNNSNKHWERIQDKNIIKKERERRLAFNEFKRQSKLITDAFNECMEIIKIVNGAPLYKCRD